MENRVMRLWGSESKVVDLIEGEDAGIKVIKSDIRKCSDVFGICY